MGDTYDQREALHAAGNVGHGWVRPRPDGARAKCGGPRMCSVCIREDAEAETQRVQALPSCKGCVCFTSYAGVQGAAPGQGHCRRFPPVRVETAGGAEWLHPAVFADMWCGEWRPKGGA